MQNKFTKNILVSAIALSFLSPASMAWSQTNSVNNSANNPSNPPQAQGGNQAIMNFVGADIESVIKAVGQYTNTTFIIDPRVKGTINLVSEKALSKSQAFDMLAATLRLQGFSVVRGDGFVKVVPEADAKLQVSPSQAKSVKGDQIATRVYNLNYESAVNLVPVLRPLISPNNTINANPGNNTLVVTDYADNLNRISKMIASLDTPNISDLDVIPVHYAVASDLATMAGKLLESNAGMGGGDGGKLSIMADPRTNSVILRAPTVARANLAKALIAKLDQPTVQAGNVHVVYLKNADATKLAHTLRSIVSFDTSTPTTSNNSSDNANSGGSLLGTGAGGPANTSGGGNTGSNSLLSKPQGNDATINPFPTGGGGSSKAGFIQADASTNTLIITASEPVYRDLRTVIDQLDMRRQQIYIESLIVEVSDTTTAGLGVQWLGLSGNSDSKWRVGGGTAFGSGGDNIFTQAIGLSAPTGTVPITPPSNGLSIGLFRQVAGKLGLGVLAQAFQKNNLGNVLSVPNLITLDNEEAKMIVGQNIPIPAASTLIQNGTGTTPYQSIDRKDVGVGLRVKPQISGDGTVKMNITQEVSSVDQSTLTNPSGVTINTRRVDTNVLVNDGEILVLGGLMQENTSNSEESVPGLSKIPFIGNLFKSKNNLKTKSNLLIFLRPTIIRDNADNNNVVLDKYDYIRSAQVRNAPPQSGLLLDTSPGTLPTLKANESVRSVLDGAFDGAIMRLNADKKQASDALELNATPPPPAQLHNTTP